MITLSSPFSLLLLPSTLHPFSSLLFHALFHSLLPCSHSTLSPILPLHFPPASPLLSSHSGLIIQSLILITDEIVKTASHIQRSERHKNYIQFPIFLYL